MIKRRIGIEITPHCLRMAIFDGDRDKPGLLRKLQHPRDAETALEDQISALLETPTGFGDRFCTAVSATSGFVRRLNFPFNDPRKIEAAAAMELASQLPTDISDHLVTITPVIAQNEQYATTVATLPQQQIKDALAPFEAINLPLHVLGLTPFTEACGLNAWLKEGILVRAHDGQLSLSLVQAGQVVSHIPCGAVGETTDPLADTIAREAALLCRAERIEPQPLCLMGSNVTAELKTALARKDLQQIEPELTESGHPVDPAFLPVCAMALASDQPMINFRRGPFTLKSEWTSLKKHLYIGAGLALTALLIVGGTAVHNYRFKTSVADSYRKQINQIFRETLPGQTAIVDPVRQLEAELNRLRETGQLVGLDKSVSALSVLRDVSRHTPPDIVVDIKTFNYEPQSLVLEGVTDSFDSVNRLAGELRKNDAFSAVRIADAKMGIDGNQVSFRLQITIGPQGGRL